MSIEPVTTADAELEQPIRVQLLRRRVARPVGGWLMPPLDDRHSVRRGTYRVVYRIDDSERTVIVLAVATRSDVYRPQ